MSTVEEEKFQEVIASMQSSFSILPSGGSSIGEGQMISSGISQLEMFDTYFNSVTDGDSDKSHNQGSTNQGQETTPGEAEEILEQAAIEESEKMAEQIEKGLAKQGIQDQVEIDFNAQYVLITLNGALLFDSGESALREEALPLVKKLGAILNTYNNNIIEVEGHTDNVPIHSSKYESNDVLSMYRALYVADYIRSVTDINPAHIKNAGRGEYLPVADNSTADGRSRNRRVEIKIYNSYNSDDIAKENDNTSDLGPTGSEDAMPADTEAEVDANADADAAIEADEAVDAENAE